MSLLQALGLPPKRTLTSAAGVAPAAESPSFGEQIKQGLRRELEDTKASAREKLLTAIGTAKGIALQATEAADTAMWAAAEVRDGADRLQKKAHDFVAGPEGSTRRAVVDTLFVAPPAPEQPSLNPISTLAKLSDDAKSGGWVDDRGNASVSTPLAGRLDKAARWVEDKVGGTPAEPEMLSTMDVAELRASVTTQAALAVVGIKEVEVVMAAVGAAAGVRAIVESYRKNGDACFKDPALWSGVIAIGLTLAGIKNTGAAAKLAAAAQKYGWMLAAVPPLTQMCIDALDPKVVDEKERQARVKRNMAVAMNIVKDVLLHKVAQAGGKPPGTAEPEGAGAPAAARVPGTPEPPAAAAESPPAAGPKTSPPAATQEVPPVVAPAERAASQPSSKQAAATRTPAPRSGKPLKGRLTEAPPKAANDNAELLTFKEINRLPGMQDFIGRLEQAHISLERIGLTEKQLVAMATSDPKGVAARLDEMLVKHLEMQRELRDNRNLPRDRLIEDDTPRTTKPNPKKPSDKTEAGNFAHRHAEVLNELIGGRMPSIDSLKPGLRAEFSVPDWRRPPKEWMRVDRIDWEAGVVHEIGPSGRRGEKLQEAKNYAAMLDKTHPRGGAKRWTGEVVVYDQERVLAYLREIGYL